MDEAAFNVNPSVVTKSSEADKHDRIKESVLMGSEDVLLNHLEINIVEAEKRINGPLTLKEYFSVYLIETRATDKNWRLPLSDTGSVWRRYSEFETLRMQLESKYPEAITPPLPEKRASFNRQNQSSDNTDPIFVDRRRVGLETFLLRVAAHPTLCHDEVFLKFLQSDREWCDLEAFNADGGKYVQQAELKLKSLSTSLRLKRLNQTVENYRNYSVELQSALNQLLRLRVRMADRLYAIYKLHANYGRVFSEWSALEKNMGDSLQKAGHYMDCYASAIDAHLEEEDIVADQLKEYYYYGQALQGLCNRHQMAQLEVEKAESHLTSQQQSKNRAHGDGYLTKFWGKVTGNVETPEERQAKIEGLERNVVDAQLHVQTTSTQLSQFSKRATEEVERFHQHKDASLQESLANYVMLQLKLSKMGLQTWKHVKDALAELP